MDQKFPWQTHGSYAFGFSAQQWMVSLSLPPAQGGAGVQAPIYSPTSCTLGITLQTTGKPYVGDCVLAPISIHGSQFTDSEYDLSNV